MSYMHIDNLYKNQDILMFKRCYAMEKIHGTSTHITWKDNRVSLFSGGVDHLAFSNLFDLEKLKETFEQMNRLEVRIYGEAYGGKCQGMSETYGKDLRFVSFETKIENTWLCVPDAEKVAIHFGLDFVPYNECSTDIDELNKQRDLPSYQSVKCGIVGPKKREGVVLRPLIELRKNNGERIISKHKNDDFAETRTPREVSEKDLEILTQANEIADEWVTEMRLTHVLEQFPDASIEQTGDIIKAMIEDVEREAEGEIVKSRKVRKAISRNTALMFKQRLKNQLAKKEE